MFIENDQYMKRLKQYINLNWWNNVVEVTQPPDEPPNPYTVLDDLLDAYLDMGFYHITIIFRNQT